MISGYTLTTFLDTLIPQQPQLKQQQTNTTEKVNIQMRNRDRA